LPNFHLDSARIFTKMNSDEEIVTLHTDFGM
jgi:hypothetical protein